MTQISKHHPISFAESYSISDHIIFCDVMWRKSANSTPFHSHNVFLFQSYPISILSYFRPHHSLWRHVTQTSKHHPISSAWCNPLSDHITLCDVIWHKSANTTLFYSQNLILFQTTSFSVTWYDANQQTPSHFIHRVSSSFQPHHSLWCDMTQNTTLFHSQNLILCRLVGSIQLQVSFAKEPYKTDDILQTRPIILRSLLIVATAYRISFTEFYPLSRDMTQIRTHHPISSTESHPLSDHITLCDVIWHKTPPYFIHRILSSVRPHYSLWHDMWHDMAQNSKHHLLSFTWCDPLSDHITLCDVIWHKTQNTILFHSHNLILFQTTSFSVTSCDANQQTPPYFIHIMCSFFNVILFQTTSFSVTSYDAKPRTK